uniref:Leucine-rich repeat-containing N-terminal plant-type domain-containing protein n=1 Tax=Oryza meridionalis TaxID=40149 RepID=A0A0E0CBG4_9ORYZ
MSIKMRNGTAFFRFSAKRLTLSRLMRSGRAARAPLHDSNQIPCKAAIHASMPRSHAAPARPVTSDQSSASAMADGAKLLLWLLLLSSSPWCFCSELDVQCLETLYRSVIDPNGILKSSWNFVYTGTAGYICKFTGVECWHPDENRVLSLRLGNLGLQGPFPQGLQNCTSMIGLDLSSNNFSGPIPAGIATRFPI